MSYFLIDLTILAPDSSPWALVQWLSTHYSYINRRKYPECRVPTAVSHSHYQICLHYSGMTSAKRLNDVPGKIGQAKEYHIYNEYCDSIHIPLAQDGAC